MYIKSPLNCVGAKYKLLRTILPKLPDQIDHFIDLFAGSMSVSININASVVHVNDNLTPLIEMYDSFNSQTLSDILGHTELRIDQYGLSKTNTQGFNSLRSEYNVSRNPLDLFVLMCFSFNHQIRFNKDGEFNGSFGKNRSCFAPYLQEQLTNFVTKLKNYKYVFSSLYFDQVVIPDNAFVYCDPPCLMSSYGKSINGWTRDDEALLLHKLENLDAGFALSSVINYQGKKHPLLINWIQRNNYQVNYSNSDYTTGSAEVLVIKSNS